LAASVLLALGGALTTAQSAPARPVQTDPQPQQLKAGAVVDDAAEARELTAHRADRRRRDASDVPAAPIASGPRTAPPPQSRKTTGGSSAPAPVRATGSLAVVVNFALSQVGKPYVWGAAGPGAYDCSGLVMASFARIGIQLPHNSEAIAARGRYVPKSQWRAGTVLHWPGHVAIYLGGGRMVHAPHQGVPVSVADVNGSPTGYSML
jgi:peptidoglycan DL-endopeptidase CwlO